MTDNTTAGNAGKNDQVALVPHNDLGMPDFRAFFELVAATIPAEVLAQIAPDSGLPPDIAERAHRHAAALTYVIDGAAAFMVEAYSSPELVADAMHERMRHAIVEYGAEFERAPGANVH